MSQETREISPNNSQYLHRVIRSYFLKAHLIFISYLWANWYNLNPVFNLRRFLSKTSSGMASMSFSASSNLIFLFCGTKSGLSQDDLRLFLLIVGVSVRIWLNSMRSSMGFSAGKKSKIINLGNTWSGTSNYLHSGPED